jgi:hypothetical protein
MTSAIHGPRQNSTRRQGIRRSTLSHISCRNLDVCDVAEFKSLTDYLRYRVCHDFSENKFVRRRGYISDNRTGTSTMYM